jgi:DNA-binding GntR family transcriptional regulator
VPIRETLIRLKGEGLVRRVPFSATFVEDLLPRDVLEIYSTRLALEPLATRLAATHAPAKLVVHLRRLCEKMTLAAKAHDLRLLDEIDLQFHKSIVVASGHARLLRAYDASHVGILSSRPGFAHLKTAPDDVTANDHRQVIEAIAAGNPAAAYYVAHVERSLLEIEEVLGITLFGEIDRPGQREKRAGAGAKRGSNTSRVFERM